MAIKYGNNLDLRQNQILNAVVQNLATAPSTPIDGQLYYDTATNKFMGRNDSTWVELCSQGHSEEELQDIVAALLVAGTNITLDYDDGANTLTINSVQRTDDNIQDLIGAMLVGATQNDIGITYDSGTNALAFTVTQLTQEEVEDICGALIGVSGAGISVAYDDGAGTITITHDAIVQAPTTSTSNPTYGGDVDVVDGITVDASGHITAVNTKTVTLPAQYTLPVASVGAIGGVKSSTDVAVDVGGIMTVSADIKDKYTQAEVDASLAGKEATTNKATDFTTVNDTLYPSVKAVNDKINTMSTGLNFLEAVTNFGDVGTTYPSPSDLDCVYVSSEGTTYQYQTDTWVDIGLSDVPLANSSTAGKMSADHFTKLEDLDPDDLSDTTTTNKFTNATEKATWNAKQDSSDRIADIDTYAADDTKYPSAKAVADKINAVLSGLEWKDAVADYAAMLSTYSSPSEGWTVYVNDEGTTYQYQGSSWVDIGLSSMPMASGTVDGLMTSAHWTKLENMTTDTITVGTNKFVSDAEKTTWNGKEATANKATSFDTVNDTLFPTVKAVNDKINTVVTSLDYKEAVATFSALASTYPTPEEGWTAYVDDEDTTYQYSGSEWINIGLSAIPNASGSVAGKMSAAHYTKMEDLDTATIINAKPDKKTFSIGNGVATSFVLNHLLDSFDVQIAIRETNAPYSTVITDVQRQDANNALVVFSVAPASNEFTAIVIG